MWPFRKKVKEELPPLPVPEMWDWDSVLGVRLQYFTAEHNDAFYAALNEARGDLEVLFEKVGSVRVQATLLPDGGTHCQWGPWLPYDPHAGKRSYDTPMYDAGGATSLVITTSLVEQKARSLVFSLDDSGNSVLVWPTDVLPTEDEATRMKSDPSFSKIPVGIGRRPEVYMYYWSSRAS